MTPARPSCYNRPAFKDTVQVQAGWGLNYGRVMVSIPDPMSKDCKQWGALGEAKLNGWNCAGCKHRPKETPA